MTSQAPYKLTMKPGKQSNYLFHISITADQKQSLRKHVLQDYQKNMKSPGFRKGHMPLEMVEKQLNPQSVLMGIIEHSINKSINHIVQEYADKKRIGQVHNVDTQSFGAMDQDGEVAFSLDVFPEVQEKDAKRKNHTAKPYSTKVTQKDITTSIDQLRSSYANFDDVDEVSNKSLMRLKVSYVDENGKDVGASKNQYIGEEELSSHADVQQQFVGKKVGDSVELDYDKASVVNLLRYSGEEKVDKIVAEILDIKQKVLPKLDQAFIDKVFNKEEDSIRSVEELKEKVKETLQKNKEENGLFERVDAYLLAVEKSFVVEVPQTLADEEVNNRLQQLSKQLGGQEGLNAYFSRMGEEEAQKYFDTIRTSAITSIRKYFIMKYIAQALELDIDWDVNQETGTIEQKLYDKLISA